MFYMHVVYTLIVGKFFFTSESFQKNFSFIDHLVLNHFAKLILSESYTMHRKKITEATCQSSFTQINSRHR